MDTLSAGLLVLLCDERLAVEVWSLHMRVMSRALFSQLMPCMACVHGDHNGAMNRCILKRGMEIASLRPFSFPAMGWRKDLEHPQQWQWTKRVMSKAAGKPM